MIYRADLAIRTEHFFIALTIHEPSYTKQSAEMGGGLSFFSDADHHSRTGGAVAHLGCGLSLDPMAGFPLVVPVCPADTSSHDQTLTGRRSLFVPRHCLSERVGIVDRLAAGSRVRRATGALAWL